MVGLNWMGGLLLGVMSLGLGCALPGRAGLETKVEQRADRLFYRVADGALYTGESRYFYEKERMTRVMNFKDGRLHGELSQKYDDGRMFGLAHYVEGKKHGEFIKFYPNQKMQQHRVYVHDRLTRHREWREDGTQKELSGWNADGSPKAVP